MMGGRGWMAVAAAWVALLCAGAIPESANAREAETRVASAPVAVTVPAPPRSAGFAPPAQAAPSAQTAPTIPGGPAEPFRAALVEDLESGRVLFAENENMQWPPASMIKMMTVLVVMDRVRDGSVSLDDQVFSSARASKMGGSQVYLAEGERFPLRDMLRAVMVSSANDASAAVAEHVAGSTDAFVELMRERGQAMGLQDSEFYSVHGLPPGKGQKADMMSARDLAKVARELRAYPEVREWAATKEAPFRDGQFTMRNTNKMLYWYRGATGLKTGYIGASGFEVTATAERDGMSLVAVVLGVPTKKGSFEEAAKLLDQGFARYQKVEPVKTGEEVGPSISVANGSEPYFRGLAADGIHLVLPRTEARDLAVEVRVPGQLAAPVARGQVVGQVVLHRGGEEIARSNVVAPRDIEAVSWWSRLW
ncbi:MAG: D-alanyl-D-alanine carboxypeptidase [Deltaproteobacteria bacterium]|nr:D-alanyl-D-alanine carboxypeptidase [Deltaproteobacteria bacterium]